MIVKKNRKGISTFIATLLLMVLAVSAGVVIYAYTMGYLGGFGGPQTMGAISIDTSTLDPTTTDNADAVIAYVRNIGKATFKCDSVYLDGVLLATGEWTLKDEKGTTSTADDTVDVAEGKVGTLRIIQDTSTTPDRFVASKTYEIKIIGVDNTQLSFQIKK
jgi:hypothetical protein